MASISPCPTAGALFMGIVEEWWASNFARSPKLFTKILIAFLKHDNGLKQKIIRGNLCASKSLNSYRGFLLKCFKNLRKTCPKDKSNLRNSVNVGSDM